MNPTTPATAMPRITAHHVCPHCGNDYFESNGFGLRCCACGKVCTHDESRVPLTPPPAVQPPPAEAAQGRELPDEAGFWFKGKTPWVIQMWYGDREPDSLQGFPLNDVHFGTGNSTRNLPRGGWLKASDPLAGEREELERLRGQNALACKVHSEYLILKMHYGENRTESLFKAHELMIEADNKRIAAEQQLAAAVEAKLQSDLTGVSLTNELRSLKERLESSRSAASRLTEHDPGYCLPIPGVPGGFWSFDADLRTVCGAIAPDAKGAK